MLLVSVLAISLGSCTDEYEYIGATVEGEQVYFSSALSSTIELNSNESSIQIPINRIQRSGALTVALDVTVPDGSNFQVPSEVSFADGDSVAYINVGYDPSAIEYGKYDTITVAIKDAQYTTPYGASSFTFAAGLSEWKTMSGNATFRDGIVCYLYGLETVTSQAEIQENVITPGIYRLVSPYGEGTTFYEEYVGDVFTWSDQTNTNIVIDATDPNYVYITGDFYPGVDDGEASSGLGVLHVFSYVYYLLNNGYTLDVLKSSAPDLFGKLEDGVITFPDNCLLANFDDTLDPLYYANSSELAVALPGYELTDYSSSFTYSGRFTDVAGNNYAQGTITLGDDVASAKYIVAENGDDIQEIISAVNEGLIDANVITSSTDVSVLISESGTYNMIIMTYDTEGNMREYSTTTFTFNISGSGTTANWQAVTSGTYDQNYYPNFIVDEYNQPVGNPFGDGIYSTTLYVDANDQSHYKLEPWLLTDGSLEFTLDDEGVISFDAFDTGVDSGTGYGNVLVVNANEIFADYPQYPFSFYAQEEGILAFGMMYYVNYNGQQGWLGGATETFTLPQTGAPAMMIKQKGTNVLKRYSLVSNPKKSVTSGHKNNFVAFPFEKRSIKVK